MIIEKIGKPAMLEQLAEEAAELSQAALELAKIHRGENPTPTGREGAEKRLKKGYSDVFLCATELELKPDYATMQIRLDCFRESWKKKMESMIDEISGCDASEDYARGWDAACEAIRTEIQRRKNTQAESDEETRIKEKTYE